MIHIFSESRPGYRRLRRDSRVIQRNLTPDYVIRFTKPGRARTAANTDKKRCLADNF